VLVVAQVALDGAAGGDGRVGRRVSQVLIVDPDSARIIC
jgi:hypothetical protein